MSETGHYELASCGRILAALGLLVLLWIVLLAVNPGGLFGPGGRHGRLPPTYTVRGTIARVSDTTDQSFYAPGPDGRTAPAHERVLTLREPVHSWVAIAVPYTAQISKQLGTQGFASLAVGATVEATEQAGGQPATLLAEKVTILSHARRTPTSTNESRTTQTGSTRIRRINTVCGHLGVGKIFATILTILPATQ